MRRIDCPRASAKRASDRPLQSPEGDWADCDPRSARGVVVMTNWPLQSPEGDWADCDDEATATIEGQEGAVLLQSPEGDWADCDVDGYGVCEALLRERGVAIPRRGLG